VTVWSADSQGNPPDTSDLRGLANQYGLNTVPVLGLSSSDMDEWSDLAYVYEADMYIPTVYHISGDMTVLAADSGNTNPASWL